MNIQDFWSSLTDMQRAMFSMAIGLKLHRKQSELPLVTLWAENAVTSKIVGELSSVACDRMRLALTEMQEKQIQVTFDTMLKACLKRRRKA